MLSAEAYTAQYWPTVIHLSSADTMHMLSADTMINHGPTSCLLLHSAIGRSLRSVSLANCYEIVIGRRGVFVMGRRVPCCYTACYRPKLTQRGIGRWLCCHYQPTRCIWGWPIGSLLLQFILSAEAHIACHWPTTMKSLLADVVLWFMADRPFPIAVCYDRLRLTSCFIGRPLCSCGCPMWYLRYWPIRPDCVMI